MKEYVQAVVRMVQNRLKNQLAKWGKWLGFDVVSREETTAFLKNYRIAAIPGNQTTLPAVDDFINPDKSIFAETVVTTEPGHVWAFETGNRQAKLLRYGTLFVDGKVLCTDWRAGRRLLGDIINRRKRVTRPVDSVIAPWSHYSDGVRFGGYYDYVVLIAAKLCRIKEALPEDVFNKSAVVYPLFETSYERELLTLIGIDANQLFDSRLTDIRFKTAIVGNSGHWFYPNMADLLALKRQVEAKLPAVSYESNRVYISRSGRRRILNEDALITLLEKYSIKIIEDKPRTIAEQVSIYRNASFIIGPHGASFTNILWCQPGAHLVELFSPNYFPDFFLFMAQGLGLRYSAHYHGPKSENQFGKLEEDIIVSIPDLERSLAALFAEGAHA